MSVAANDRLLDVFERFVGKIGVLEISQHIYFRDVCLLVSYANEKGLALELADASFVNEWIRSDLSNVRKHSGYGPSDRTISRRLVSARHFFHSMIDEGLIRENPAVSVHYTMSNDEIDYAPVSLDLLPKIMLKLGNAPRDVRDAALLNLIFETKASTTAISGLSMDFMKLQRDMRVHVIFPDRSHVAREFALSEQATRAITHYVNTVRPMWAGPDNTRVFLSNKRRPMTRQGIWKILRDRAACAGTTALHTRRLRAATPTQPYAQWL